MMMEIKVNLIMMSMKSNKNLLKGPNPENTVMRMIEKLIEKVQIRKIGRKNIKKTKRNTNVIGVIKNFKIEVRLESIRSQFAVVSRKKKILMVLISVNISSMLKLKMNTPVLKNLTQNTNLVAIRKSTKLTQKRNLSATCAATS